MSQDPDMALLAPGGLGAPPPDLGLAATAGAHGVGSQPGVGGAAPVAGSFKPLG